MDEQRDPRNLDTPSHDLNAPADPPYAVLRPEARRAALFSYLGPVIVLFAIAGIALIYWGNRGPVDPAADDGEVIGTVGREEGGGSPDPSFGGTRDELEYRGGGDAGFLTGATVTSIDRALRQTVSGQPVTFEDEEIDRVDGTTIWLKDGDHRIPVTLPPGVAAPRRGEQVDVNGLIEKNEQGVRVRASAINVR